MLSFDRFWIREAVVSSHSGVNYFVFPLQGQPTAKLTAAVKTRRERGSLHRLKSQLNTYDDLC